MKKCVSVISFAILMFLAASPAFSQPIQKVTSVEGITEYRLSNGLRVLLFPDPTKQTITVNITYMVGSKHENYGETGMAHLLEHMLFKGSPKHPNLRQEMTERGARWNASTWLDRTNYFEILSASPEMLEFALEMEADRMINCNVSKKDLEDEMTVVRNEFESGENNPAGVLMERMMSTAYLWHNYGNTTIGARADIENVPIERLQEFYRRYYQPDNAVLLVAGRFDEPQALELIKKYFVPIPKPTRPLPTFYTNEPAQDGEREVILRRVGEVQYAAVVYHIPSGSHPDYAAIDIMSQILADTPSGRLYKALVETKLASSVFGFNFQLKEPGIALFGAEVRTEGSLDEAKKALTSMVETFGAKPPTPEELERAKTALLKNIDLTLNSADRVGLEMSEWIAMGDWRLFFLHRDRLKNVKAEDVQRVGSEYLKQSNRTLGLFIPAAKPDRAQIPPPPDVQAALKDYKGEAAVAVGEAFDPSPSNIESRVSRSQPQPGLKFALLSKKTRGATVIGTMTFRHGSLPQLKGRLTEGSLSGEMLMRGTTKHTRQQIQDEFDRLKARVSVGGSPTRSYVSIETIRENLPAVLNLVAEILREPAFPENEFELLKQENLAYLEQQRTEPESLADYELERHLNPYPKDDPRYIQTLDEEIAEIKAAKLEDVKKFYSDFYGGSTGEIVFVGDFDQNELNAQLIKLFQDWKSPQPYERIPDEYQDVAAINKAIDTPDKTNAVFLAGLNMKIRDDNPDYPALVFGNYMLGSASNARLKERIREKEGLSYGVGSSLSASPLDESGGFGAFAIFAPTNAAKLEAAFKEEIDKALNQGFTEEEIKIAKAGYKQARQLSRAQDRELAGRLSSYLFIDRTLKWDEEFENKVMSLTPAQIQTAMKKYIDPSKLSIVKAGDF